MEKFHNEYIDMTYLRKRYINITPTGNNPSFTERQNLPYSVLLGLIFPWNIFITTQCSGWGSSYVFIKYQKYDNSHQNNYLPLSILHLVIKKHILSQIPASEHFVYVFLQSQKDSLILWISPINR